MKSSSGMRSELQCSEIMIEVIKITLEIIDKAFQTQFRKEFQYVYLSPEHITIEEMSELCQSSIHKINCDIRKLDLLVRTTINVYTLAQVL